MSAIKRRTFVRGLGLGVAAPLLAPLGDKLISEALGAEPRKRLIVITQGNGLPEPIYKHQVRSESDFDLREAFKPLEPYKSDLLLLSPFFNPFDRALHGNNWATLSVQPSNDSDYYGNYTRTPGGVTIDRLVAKTLSQGDPFPSLVTGIIDGAEITSADGRGMKVPALRTPVKAWKTLFANSVGMPTAGPDPKLAMGRRQRLLDFVREDVKRMNARLAGPERAKLDQVLSSLGEVEARVMGGVAAGPSCTDAAPPAAALDSERLSPEIVAGHMHVAFMGLLCGLSHVAHVALLAGEGPHAPFPWLGDNVPDHSGQHEASHANNWPMLTKMHAFWMSNVALLMKVLHAVPEGNGTMADQTLVMYVNTGGGEHHGGQESHAVLLLGSAGGVLKTGRYVAYAPKKHALSDVYVSVANALGVPIETFGEKSVCKGPLPGLT